MTDFPHLLGYGLAGYYLILNLLLLLLFAYDKRQAQNKKARLPEKTLLLLGLLGGMCGGLAGMRMFKHKTQKRYFSIWYINSLLAHLLLLYVLYR